MRITEEEPYQMPAQIHTNQSTGMPEAEDLNFELRQESILPRQVDSLIDDDDSHSIDLEQPAQK